MREEESTAHHSEVDIDYMESLFGNSTVQVTPCCFKTDTIISKKKREEEEEEETHAAAYDDADTCSAWEMTFSQYCSWWRRTKDDDDNNNNNEEEEEEEEEGISNDHHHYHHPTTTTTSSLLYLKDWHLSAEYPHYHAYQCPDYFQDDWLNEWLDYNKSVIGYNHDYDDYDDGGGSQSILMDRAKSPPPPPPPRETATQPPCVTTSDYKFVYLGPAGTSTPLHADVVRSYSWSANIIGRKMWRLLPPEYVGLLYDSSGTSIAPCFYNTNIEEDRSGDSSGGDDDNHTDITTIILGRRYPRLKEANEYIVTVYQEEGEAIFVPSGWFHEVINITDVVSINHNWFNAHNGGMVWRFLQWERREAARLIEDCRELLCSDSGGGGGGKDGGEFEGLVQRNMGVNCGFDFASYGELLRFIAGRALSRVGGEVGDDGGRGGVEETLYRLQQVGMLLEQLIAEEEGECRAFFTQEIEVNRRVLDKGRNWDDGRVEV